MVSFLFFLIRQSILWARWCAGETKTCLPAGRNQGLQSR